MTTSKFPKNFHLKTLELVREIGDSKTGTRKVQDDSRTCYFQKVEKVETCSKNAEVISKGHRSQPEKVPIGQI